MFTRPTAPRSIGGVIDDAISLYRASFRGWLVPSIIGAAFSAGAGVWLALKVGLEPTPQQMLAIWKTPTIWGAYAVMFVSGIWTYLAVIIAIVRTARGEDAGPAATLAAALKVLVPAILGSILFGFGWTIGLVLLVIPGIYIAGRWIYWMVAMIDEGSSAPAGLARSWKLSKGFWWRGVSIVFIACLIMVVLFMAVSFTVGFVVAFGRPDRVATVILTQAIGGAFGIFMTPAIPCALVAAYYDLQLRREGGDLAGRLSGLAST